MPTEAIHISTGTILRYRVKIIISITVQYEIMTSPHQIKTNSHAIVHRQILVNIMISTLIVYTLRLSMLPDSMSDMKQYVQSVMNGDETMSQDEINAMLLLKIAEMEVRA